MYELTCQFISLANLIKIFTYTCMNQLNQHVSLSLSQMYLSLELPTTTYLKFVSVLRLSVLFCPLLRPPSLSLSPSLPLSLTRYIFLSHTSSLSRSLSISLTLFSLSRYQSPSLYLSLSYPSSLLSLSNVLFSH
uniref:Uncharacterized protein n=1 Tax=Cacopsylla melanoneura TaxID=428564 RepID=A0A8D8VYF3_9HEMI